MDILRKCKEILFVWDINGGNEKVMNVDLADVWNPTKLSWAHKKRVTLLTIKSNINEVSLKSKGWQLEGWIVEWIDWALCQAVDFISLFIPKKNPFYLARGLSLALNQSIHFTIELSTLDLRHVVLGSIACKVPSLNSICASSTMLKWYVTKLSQRERQHRIINHNNDKMCMDISHCFFGMYTPITRIQLIRGQFLVEHFCYILT